MRVMVWIEHIAPNINFPARIYFAQNSRTGFHVVGEDRSSIQVASLASPAPIEHAYFIVRHHITFRVPGFVHPPGLISEQFDGLWLGWANHGLIIVDCHRV